MSACKEVVHRLAEHAAGTLHGEAAAVVVAHLDVCPGCRRAAVAAAALHAALVRATTADAANVAPLLARARARALLEARPRAWRRALAAAALFLVVAMGLVVAFGPPCLRGDCPTARRMVLALLLNPSNVEPPPSLGVPSLQGLQPIGAARLPDDEGAEPVAFFERGGARLVVFQDPGSGTMWDPGAHTHPWETTRLGDGREYVQITHDGRSVLAWVDGARRVWCCVCADPDHTFALASAVRRST